ncbi:MAG: hypothetical protein LBG10_09935 [Treponema sp.]|nr:hypothetical protein [Treponema sp.]
MVILSSCIGIRAEISVREDGSGRISMEYRISRIAESLGKLDGNERWQTVPLGKADFDRTLDRLPGMRMVSFSSKDDGKDMVNQAELEFTDMASLLAFLSASGEGASFVQEKGKNRLSLILYPGVQREDPELFSLIKEVFRTYDATLSFSAPGETALALTGAQGRPLGSAEGVQVQSQEKKVSLSVDMGDLLTSPEGLGAEFIW